jgi:proline iminopeptidase
MSVDEARPAPTGVRNIYPPIEAYATHRLPVSGGHELYIEEAGDPAGISVVFLHGGPGGGIDPMHRRFFDPLRYRIVLFDQRGAGRSTPHASLEHNTTWDLVDDMERIRERLSIESWHVFGGSWGSTLALAYATQHRERVLSLVLRGIFLLRQDEIQWFYQRGASEIFPDAFETYLSPIPPSERGDLLSAYHRRLTSKDPEVVKGCARAWSIWEGTTSRLLIDETLIERCGVDAFAIALARIECHYFVHGGFFEDDGWLLGQVPRLRSIPCTIVQGRYDVVCPARSAWDLHRAWPEAKLVIVPDAGHASTEPGIVNALVSATDEMAALGAPG